MRGSLLDVGCGEGEFWRAATDAGWDAYGVDIHVQGVTAARVFWRTDRLFAGGIDHVPALFTRQFDVVNLSQVMEHLPDPIGALRRLAQVVRPGGLVTIDVPNLQAAAGWVDRDRLMDVPAHLHYWSRGTLRRVLETSGYTAIDVASGVGLSRLLTRFASPTAAGKMAGQMRRIGTWGGGVYAVAERSARPESNTWARIGSDG
jgi:SAM-dependent methyltransferase